ncbi:MAG: glycosyltransferase family 8 protein [Candidatus Paceibacterota bacterium]|jgi:lipopolysaccharide biosynthesis glycosyltransferase
MNILFTCDSNYVMPLSVCLTSLFENNAKNDISVYVLHSGFEGKDERSLADMASKYGQKINLIRVNGSYFAEAPALRWSKETYYRLLISELLPKDLDRLLYLDMDMVINKPLNDLYDIDLGECSLGASCEKLDHSAIRRRVGLDAKGLYFQAGVLLFDVKKTRKVLSYDSAMEVIRSLGKNLLIVDQDVINVLFDGKIKLIDKKFNNFDITNFDHSNVERFFNHTDGKELDETYIFHYSCSKPWNNMFSGACENLWYKYLKLSPYADLYEKKFNTLKYRMFRTGIMKLFFYKYIDVTPFINKMSAKMLSPKLYDSFKKFYRKNVK